MRFAQNICQQKHLVPDQHVHLSALLSSQTAVCKIYVSRHTVGEKGLNKTQFWSKTTLITGVVCGTWLYPPFCKMSTFIHKDSFLRALREVAPEMELFLKNHWQYIKN